MGRIRIISYHILVLPLKTTQPISGATRIFSRGIHTYLNINNSLLKKKYLIYTYYRNIYIRPKGRSGLGDPLWLRLMQSIISNITASLLYNLSHKVITFFVTWNVPLREKQYSFLHYDYNKTYTYVHYK